MTIDEALTKLDNKSSVLLVKVVMAIESDPIEKAKLKAILDDLIAEGTGDDKDDRPT